MIQHTVVSFVTSSIKHWSVKNGDSETYIKHLLLHNFGVQPFSLTYLYSMVQNLKSTCISKNTLLQVVFSTLFSVIDLWSNTVSCLIYYLKYFLFKDVFKRHFDDQNNVLIKKCRNILKKEQPAKISLQCNQEI